MARDLDELPFSITLSTSACGVSELPMLHSHPGSIGIFWYRWLVGFTSACPALQKSVLLG